MERAPDAPSPPTLADALLAQRARSRAKSSSAFAAAERLIDHLRRDRLDERAPEVGQRAPDFSLPDNHGNVLRLGDLVGRSAVVLAFYRGGW